MKFIYTFLFAVLISAPLFARWETEIVADINQDDVPETFSIYICQKTNDLVISMATVTETLSIGRIRSYAPLDPFGIRLVDQDGDGDLDVVATYYPLGGDFGAPYEVVSKNIGNGKFLEVPEGNWSKIH